MPSCRRRRVQCSSTFSHAVTLPRCRDPGNLGGGTPPPLASLDGSLQHSTPKPGPPVTRSSPHLRAPSLGIGIGCTYPHIRLPPHFCRSFSSTSIIAQSLLHAFCRPLSHYAPSKTAAGPRPFARILLNSLPPPACIHRRLAHTHPTVIPTLLACPARSRSSAVIPPCLTPPAAPPPS